MFPLFSLPHARAQKALSTVHPSNIFMLFSSKDLVGDSEGGCQQSLSFLPQLPTRAKQANFPDKTLWEHFPLTPS
jgi:hypothetical protein